MCGIIGVVGEGSHAKQLTDGLRRLEYRGYDSAGLVVTFSDGEMQRRRVANGKNSLSELELETSEISSESIVSGIGHTRWATHGRPSLPNAHPHLDCSERLAVIQNGIVENYAELKVELIEKGHIFSSETDTEVISHLLEDEMRTGVTLLEAVKRSALRMRGAMSFVALSLDAVGELVGFKRMAPMIIGTNGDQWFIASDIPAILDQATSFFHLEDDSVASITKSGVEVFAKDGSRSEMTEFVVDWTLDSAEKAGYEDFMSKEIFEQPGALRDTLAGRLRGSGEIEFDETSISNDDLARINKVFIVACGTSFHAGMVAKYAIEHWTKMPVELDISSEFRYRDPVVDERTLVVAVSQSGETLDTLAALHEAKNLGAQTIAVCNVVGSSMARLADSVLYTRAGPEVGVAATKTHTAQIGALLLLALKLSRIKGQLFPSEIDGLYQELIEIPSKIEEVLDKWDSIRSVAQTFSERERFYFIGRHVGFPVALEGALKLKEISYLPAEGYPAGELKHGPIAMLDKNAVVIAMASKTRLFEKIVSNIEEVRARDSAVIVIGNSGSESVIREGEYFIEVPQVHPLLAPLVDVVPLQIFAYHMARIHGEDVDRPRNLAKTVTVE
ncbi:MAG: glutamine--fructose-6-phosphate transaminase (isomerizing) [Actinomycetota bacterium]|nr:glutamine--fructose-6-phosphate transaminase (isomerizing) [Actinomycetota bacterium]